MQIRGNFSYFFGTTLLPMLDEIIRDGFEEESQTFPELFQEKTMDGSIKSSAGRSGFGLPAEITAEGGEIRTDRRVQRFRKQWEPRKWGIGVEVTRELVEDDKFDVVADDARELGRSVREGCEIDAASTFNNGFDTNYTGPDGKPLFSATHPMVKYGSVQSNLLSVAADLDPTSLELALIDFMTMKRDNGQHMSNPTPRLVITPANMFNATEILKSNLRSGDANNNVNAIRTTGAVERIITWKYLTDADAWFLVAPPSRTGLKWYWRKRPYKVVDNDPRTERSFRGIAYRKDHGWDDYLGVYGTPGA